MNVSTKAVAFKDLVQRSYGQGVADAMAVAGVRFNGTSDFDANLSSAALNAYMLGFESDSWIESQDKRDELAEEAERAVWTGLLGSAGYTPKATWWIGYRNRLVRLYRDAYKNR